MYRPAPAIAMCTSSTRIPVRRETHLHTAQRLGGGAAAAAAVAASRPRRGGAAERLCRRQFGDAQRHQTYGRARPRRCRDRQVDLIGGHRRHGGCRRPRRTLNLQTNTAGKFDADAAKALLDTTAKQIDARGWHVQFYTGLGNISALKDHFMQLPFPVVFDHFGRASADKGPGQPGFDALLALVKSGHAYVKISAAYRISKKAPDYADATPLAQALVAANADRIVWGNRLAASGFRCRPRQAAHRDRRAVPDRRRPAVQSTGQVGAGRRRCARRSWSTIRPGSTASRPKPPDGSPGTSRPRRAWARRRRRRNACI